jgi:FMN phosphatase YigB (HAD superfamily)
VGQPIEAITFDFWNTIVEAEFVLGSHRELHKLIDRIEDRP